MEFRKRIEEIAMSGGNLGQGKDGRVALTPELEQQTTRILFTSHFSIGTQNNWVIL